MSSFYDPQYLLGCPAPFYSNASYAPGGSREAQVCIPNPNTNSTAATCCLPCPSTQFIYSDSYTRVSHAATGINIASLAFVSFILISYAVLPVQATRSHYLNSSLLVGVMFLNLGFIVPFARRSKTCYNRITPNDMYSSTSCAFSGAFIAGGGILVPTWILIRTMSMHLQICWNLTPGRRFYYLTQIGGWVVPAALFTTVLSVSGVSFRFGPGACHVSHRESVAAFWGWLLAITGMAILLQLGTIAFCAHVYIRNMWADESPTTADAEAPSYSSSQRPQNSREIYKKLKRVLALQWRGLAMATLIVADVIFFAVVFVLLDKANADTEANHKRAQPWISCLIAHPDDVSQCFALGQSYLVSQNTISGVLIVLSLVGPGNGLILLNWGFFTAWKQWFKSRVGHGDEFESIQSGPPPKPSVNMANDGEHQLDQLDQHDQHDHHDSGDPMFEMQQPNKEYAISNHVVNDPNMVPHDMSAEQYHAAMHYPYQQQPVQYSYDPTMAHTYYNPGTTTIIQGGAMDTPQMPNNSFIHPNPNIAHMPPIASHEPTYGNFEVPVVPRQPTYQEQHAGYPTSAPYEQAPPAEHLYRQ